MMRKRNHAGVIASRFHASAKNANASSMSTGTTCDRSRTRSGLAIGEQRPLQASGRLPGRSVDSSKLVRGGHVQTLVKQWTLTVPWQLGFVNVLSNLCIVLLWA